MRLADLRALVPRVAAALEPTETDKRNEAAEGGNPLRMVCTAPQTLGPTKIIISRLTRQALEMEGDRPLEAAEDNSENREGNGAEARALAEEGLRTPS